MKTECGIQVMPTVGPAWDRDGVMQKIAATGIREYRVNLAQSIYEEHKERIGKVRTYRGDDTLIAADLPGNKLRTDDDHETITLHAGRRVLVSCAENPPPGAIPFKHPSVMDSVMTGTEVAVGDGEGLLVIDHKVANGWDCFIKQSGEVKKRKGLMFLKTKYKDLKLPDVPAHDLEGIDFAVAEGLQVINASYIWDTEQLMVLTTAARAKGFTGQIVVKGELLYEIQNKYRELIDESSGMMVARGDGSVSVGVVRVHVLQREIAKYCGKTNKWCNIGTGVAGGMEFLSVMDLWNAGSVFNVIRDLQEMGSAHKTMMLSGEVSMGAYPVETILAVLECIAAAEASY